MKAAFAQAYARDLRIVVALVLVTFLAAAAPAVAEPIVVDVGSSPVVVIRLHTGSLVVRTWNRSEIRIVAQGRVRWSHADADQVAARLHTTQNVLAQTVTTASGELTLPPESFVLPRLDGAHDGVRIVGNGRTVVTVPQGTALVMARVMSGNIAFRNYHRGAFFAVVHDGAIALRDVSGTGFAQVLRGRIVASNSSFDRLRARTAIGMILFEHCVAQQIQATSIRGSIAYDDGSFLAGLARFESQSGDVALGIGSGGAQISARGAAGRIYTAFRRPSSVVARGLGARGAIGGGGPTVTASASNGKLLIYDGALRGHPSIARNVPELRRALLPQARHSR